MGNTLGLEVPLGGRKAGELRDEVITGEKIEAVVILSFGFLFSFASPFDPAGEEEEIENG